MCGPRQNKSISPSVLPLSLSISGLKTPFLCFRAADGASLTTHHLVNQLGGGVCVRMINTTLFSPQALSYQSKVAVGIVTLAIITIEVVINKSRG